MFYIFLTYGFGYGLRPKAEVFQGRTFGYGRRWKLHLRINTGYLTFTILKFVCFTFQYFSIMKKMNVLGCNDQFFNTFLSILSFITSCTIAFLNNEVPGKMGINYYMCTGEDPRDFKYLGSKVTVSHYQPNNLGNVYKV